MRSAFFETLFNIAAEDSNVFLLTGDVGFGVFEPFQKYYGSRYINVGVAEANLTGIAAGLALAGKTPFTYSIANFPTIRSLEQIRNDVCYNNANVKIIAVGGGLAYGPLGATHHATEDISIMRSLPNMVVMVPSDPVIAGASVRLAYEYEGPVYVRLGRSGEPTIYETDPHFEFGQATKVREGRDLTIISTGSILRNVIEVSNRLEQLGIYPTVLDVHTIKPIDKEKIISCAMETNIVFTVEEHSIIGGLGSAVAEVLVDSMLMNVSLKRIALKDEFSHVVGTQEYMLERLGLSADGIFKSIFSNL